MFEVIAQADGAVVLGIFLLVLLAIGLAIAATIFWILMIIDCIQRKKMTDGERIAWILVLIFLGILGAVVYYIAVKRT